MTREIKFRAYDAINEVMEYNVNVNQGKPVKQGYQWFNTENTVLHSELMQYTGLKDKNGKGIYEGDHLYAEGNFGDEDYIGYVDYCENDAKFVVVQTLHGRMEWIPNQDCWVKGNIYEEKKD